MIYSCVSVTLVRFLCESGATDSLIFASVYGYTFNRFGGELIFYLMKFFFGRVSELIVTVCSFLAFFFIGGVLLRDPLSLVSKMSLSFEDYLAIGRAGNLGGVAAAML